MEAFLDAGYGECLLAKPDVAEMTEEALLHWDGRRYDLLGWVIMPNHLHFVFEMREGWPLGEVMKRFKTYTANRANEILERAGSFWYPDYWDRYVRDAKHLQHVIRYVHENPVKAGLVEKAKAWLWSSARLPLRETSREMDHEGKF